LRIAVQLNLTDRALVANTNSKIEHDVRELFATIPGGMSGEDLEGDAGWEGLYDWNSDDDARVAFGAAADDRRSGPQGTCVRSDFVL
jgi:hypothetical protein